MSQKSKSSTLTLLSVILGLLVLAVIWLAMDRANIKSQLEGRLTEMQSAQNELELEYNQAIANLEEMRGDNERLNELIDQQKKELQTQKNRISSLIRKGKDVDAARKEIEELKAQAIVYLEEIETLKSENEALATTNTILATEKDSLSSNLKNQLAIKEELIEERTVLAQQNIALNETNEELDKKVTRASVLPIANMEADPVMLKNDKAKTRKKADKVDKLNVCFMVEPNEIANEGVETFLLRIVQPSGETMSIRSKGSGSFVNLDNETEMLYTMSGSFDYKHEQKNLCMEWMPEVPFQVGDYEIELYNKGYLAAKTGITLK